jgi:hypothetical protein
VFERHNIVSDGDLHTAAARLSGLLAGTQATADTQAPRLSSFGK